MSDLLSRRSVLMRSLTVLAGAAVVACGKKELSCADTAGMSAQDLQMREALRYVDRAGDPAKTCDACQLYKPGAPDQCGGCTVVKGPINPKGSCTSWAAKAT